MFIQEVFHFLFVNFNLHLVPFFSVFNFSIFVPKIRKFLYIVTLFAKMRCMDSCVMTSACRQRMHRKPIIQNLRTNYFLSLNCKYILIWKEIIYVPIMLMLVFCKY